jgi:hypothetical protein
MLHYKKYDNATEAIANPVLSGLSASRRRVPNLNGKTPQSASTYYCTFHVLRLRLSTSTYLAASFFSIVSAIIIFIA